MRHRFPTTDACPSSCYLLCHMHVRSCVGQHAVHHELSGINTTLRSSELAVLAIRLRTEPAAHCLGARVTSSTETRAPRIHLPAQARRTGRAEEVAAPPSLHRPTEDASGMNEAETRAEHIDPALKAAGWGVVEGSRILREYPITPGRIEGARPTRQAAHRRLRAGVSQHQAGRDRGQGVGQAADRRRRAGQELRRQAGRALRLCHQRPGHLRHRHGNRQGGRDAVLSHAGRTLER